jgi:DNA-binding transcriptional LysR family regulator
MAAMDSDALLTVLTIHRAGGFSAAADALGRSQPAISRRIALLEAELGGPVFERTAAGVRLSALGEALLPHAERALAAIEDARAAVREMRDQQAGSLTLALVGTLAGLSLTQTLRRFAAEAPRARLDLRTANSATVSDLVRTGAATIGVRYFADRSDDLACHGMPPERLAVVCAPDHPRAGRRVGQLAALAGEHWLAFPRRNDSGEAAAGTLYALFQARGIAELRWSAIDSLTAQKRMVEAGIGLALLPESAVVDELRAKTLAVVTVADLDAANPVFAVVRRDGYLSRAAHLLLDILTEGGYRGETGKSATRPGNGRAAS